MINRKCNNDINTLRICIDNYEDEIPKGRIYHSSKENTYYFTGIMSFMKIIEQIMNDNNFPQLGMQIRQFAYTNENKRMVNEQICTDNEEIGNFIRGRLATYRIRIMFRQSATWQGTIRWLEEGTEEHFRSALELMMLIDSTLPGKNKLHTLKDNHGRKNAINE